MTDKLTGNAPYFRTVPSSPEPDDDEISLPGIEEAVIEDKMSPAAKLPEKMATNKIGENKEKTQNEEEEDEEAVLRRRLLEKKKEKESKSSSTSSTNRKEPLPSKSGRENKQQQQQQTRKDAPPVKRERIVWNRDQQQEKAGAATTHSKIQETSAAAGRKEKREKVEEQQQKKAKESSTISKHGNNAKHKAPSKSNREEKRKGKHEKEREAGKAESKSNSATNSNRHHHRKETVDKKEKEKEESSVKKRPREKSDSSEGGRGGKDGRKTMKKEEKTNKSEAIAAAAEAMMEEVSPPLEEAKPEEMEIMHQGDGQESASIPADDEELTTNKKPKKYSKFESSPELSDEEEMKGTKEEEEIYSDIEQSEFGMEAEGKNANLLGEEEEDDDDDMLVDDGLLEHKDFDKLTDAEKVILSSEKLKQMEARHQKKLISKLPVYYPGISGCRSVVEYECLNKISEGTFGVVYRAQERRTDEIVALKRLKMEKEHQGFPITSLREINMLLKCGTHPNVLNVREVVVGSSMDKIYMVMEYVEHDMKSLMELMKSRNKKWTISQVKTLMRQLLSGVEHMHEEYVIHRDLKTSNLLLSHQGILKIGDFGLAREFGEPIKPYTPVVVTLWYRSPELLLGTKIYSTPVDIWSVGCIFGEFLKLDPMFAGRTEIEQMQKIFKEVGTPNEQIWPGCMELPGMKTGVFPDTPYNQLRRKFASELPDDDGYELLNKLLALDPKKRLSASSALKSKWFQNDPKPTPSSSFPTWPAKSEHNKKPPNEPAAPRKPVGGFTLKFDVPKF